METNYKTLMEKKSDEGLMEYIINIDKYVSGAVIAAVNELKKRGHNFTNEELEDIEIKTVKKIQSEKKNDNFWSSNSSLENVVDDPDAPLLYSKGVIIGFSTIFTVIFGAVLLASNLKNKKRKWTVISIGILYTIIVIIVSNQTPVPGSLTFALNTGGGYALTASFWDKYIGENTKYRNKPVWKPLIISIIVIIPFIIAAIYA
jgi:uncharacterized integral membrane protein